MRKSRRFALSWRALVIISVLTSLCVRVNAVSASNPREKLFRLLSQGGLREAEGVRSPRSVAFDTRRGRALMTEMSNETLFAVDMTTRQVVAEAKIENGPVHVAVSSDGSIAAVAELYSEELSIVDLSDMTLAGKVSLPCSISEAIFGKTDTLIYALSRFDNKLFLIDAQRGTVSRSVEVASCPRGLTWARNGHLALLTARFPARVAAFNAEDLSLAWEIGLGGKPVGIAVVAERVVALIQAGESAQLVVFDVRTGEILRDENLDFVPISLSGSEQAQCAIVTGEAGQFIAFDPVSFQVTRLPNLPIQSPQLVLSPDVSGAFLVDTSSGKVHLMTAASTLVPKTSTDGEGDQQPQHEKSSVLQPVKGGRTVHFESNSLEAVDRGKELRGEGDVRIATENVEFKADRVVYDTEENSFHASGNVSMTRDGSVVTADETTYDIESETGELIECRGRLDPYYFRAPSLKRTGPNTAEIVGGYLTTCDLEKPHYRIAAEKMELTDDEKLVVHHPTVYLGRVPVLRIPRYTHSLGAEMLPIEVDIGHESRLGYFLRTGYKFDVTEKFSGTVHGDIYTDEGFGTGLGGEFIPFDTGELEFETYMTTKEKGRAELYYTQDIPHDWRLIAQLEQWTEEDFLEQFYYDEYKRRTEPETFLNLTRTRPYNIISATVRKRTNGFVEETERLPELNVTFLERQIGTTPFYYAIENSLGYLVDRPGEESALRNFTGGRVSYAGHPTEWLSVVPFVGLEGTYYSQGTQDEEDLYRTSFLSGVTLGTRFHRVYSSPLEGFSAFKHIVVPTLTYTYRPTPDVRKREAHEFDALDDVLGRSRIGFELDNVLLSKTRAGEQKNLARLTLYSGVDLSNEQRKSVDWATELQVTPSEKFGFTFDADVHNADEDFTRFNGRFYYKQREDGGPEVRLGFGYSEIEDGVFNEDVSYYLATDLGKKWRVSLEHRYDFHDNHLEYQEYRVWRDLHCFEGALSYRIRERSERFFIIIGLKAFPRARARL